MGIFGRTINFEANIAKQEHPPVIVNDLDTTIPEDRNLLDKLMMTNYQGPTFSMEPTCECGELKGGDKRGRICSSCHTEVLPHTERKIQSELWIRRPDSVKALINPFIFAVLQNAYNTKSNIDVMRWLIDKTYHVDVSNFEPIQELKKAGIKRGLNFFVENFDDIMNVIFSGRIFPRNEIRDELPRFIEMVREDIFTEYLPIPNKISFVTERSATGKYAEIEKIGTAIDAVNTICSLKSRLELPSPQVEENAAVKAILNLVDFYGRQIKEVQGKKEGFWRKLIFGTRMPFSGRAVITSLTEVHDYDELHIPWGLFIVMYRFHIENKLYKRGYTPNQAKGFISRCIREWNPEMREIIDELIEESPYATHSGKKGLPVIFNRNPSLLLSSIQHFLITEIKNDVTDNSISMSVLVLSGMNADFDGDR